jgi:uncharacterized iron-regulated protein
MIRSLTFAVAALLLAGGCAALPWEQQSAPVLRASDHTRITFDALLQDLQSVRMVFVGEEHDVEADHRVELRVIQGLEGAGVPLAIGLEMFRSEDQIYLDQWVAGSISEEAFIEHYHRNWSLPWPLYRPIFLFAREKQISMVGLNVPQEITRQVARRGFSSLSPEQREALPAGVHCEVGPEYEAFIRRALGAHPHSGMSFTHFCEAQMVWDTAMARHALEYLRQHPERAMVVLAGCGHAWKPGIPRQLRQRSAVSMRVLLLDVPDRLDPCSVTPKEADYVWLGQ